MLEKLLKVFLKDLNGVVSFFNKLDTHLDTLIDKAQDELVVLTQKAEDIWAERDAILDEIEAEIAAVRQNASAQFDAAEAEAEAIRNKIATALGLKTKVTSTDNTGA